MRGQIDDVAIWRAWQVNHMKALSGRKFDLSSYWGRIIRRRTQVRIQFEEQQGIPVDHERLVFMFKRKKLADGFKLSDYQVRNKENNKG